MHMKVKKYTGQPTVLVISATDAKALGLEHDQIVDVPVVKIVGERPKLVMREKDAQEVKE